MSSGHVDPVTTSLVIVGGPYKSGTSRLCEFIEKRGFHNPAWITGAPEYGHGIAIPRYLTRECGVARALNRQLVSATAHERSALERVAAGYLCDMFYLLGSRVLIKDPYMKLTADVWARAARNVGVRRVVLCLTNRDEAALRRSWTNARFVARESRRIPHIFQALIAPSLSIVAEGLSQLGLRPFYVEALRSSHRG